MTIKTYPYESSDYIETEEDIAEFAAECTDDDDPKIIAQFVRTILRAHGLNSLAASTGLPRRAIVDALSGQDSDGIGTLSAVLRAESARVAPQAAE